jgi:glycosyltransferase involved in cell wall biosynthesis
VITDGGSTDATPEIIEDYVRRGFPVRLIREKAALPGRGRNLANSEASFEWLAFTDTGIRPAADWRDTRKVRFRKRSGPRAKHWRYRVFQRLQKSNRSMLWMLLAVSGVRRFYCSGSPWLVAIDSSEKETLNE